MDIKEQVCINNMTYRRYGFDYFLESVKRLGLCNIELSGCHPHYTVYEAKEFAVNELAGKIKRAGIRVAAIEPEQNFLPVNIASGQQYLREESIRRLQFYIENAAAFDCGQVIVNPGKGMMDAPLSEARKYSCDSLCQLQRTAEKCGVTLLLQNVSSCISALTPDLTAFAGILNEVGGSHLGASVNTCAVCAGGETLDQYFALLGGHIKMVQIADSDTEDEQLVLGDGGQDIKQHLETLEKYKYNGPAALEITMEEYAYEAETYYARSLAVLRGLCDGGESDE